MELDKIKDIIVARWAFIAKNAAMISNIAQAMGESEELNKESIKQIEDRLQDIDINLASLKNMREAIFMGKYNSELHD